jgi:predicted alpha/beta-hydrolase family hydrolase
MAPPSEFIVDVAPHGSTRAILYEADQARTALILGHGAGAGQLSPFMIGFAREICALGITVATFDFLYIRQRRRTPDRTPVLEGCYRAVIDAVRQRIEPASLFIGGKSMGGRIATQVAAAGIDPPIDGLVLLGYPLHPPGRPTERRDAHLPAIGRPMFFAQGSRDTFGTGDELSALLKSLRSATLHVVEGGDHSFKISARDTARQAAVYEDVQQAVVNWINSVAAPGGTSSRAPRRSR